MSETADPRPVLFLDVDGVINAIGPKAHHGDFERVGVPHGGRTWPIHYRPTIIDRLNALHRTGVVEIVWLTTWGSGAVTGIAPAVGLDRFDALPAPADLPEVADGTWSEYPNQRWWKLGLVNRSILASPNRPVIWLDDDLARPIKEHLRRLHPDLPMRLVTPMQAPGLTDEHLDVIEAFAQAYRGWQGAPHAGTNPGSPGTERA